MIEPSCEQLLPALPKSLAFQLDLFLKRTLFLRLPFFKGCAIKQIMALAPLISSEHMMPGRVIIREGAPLTGLFMVMRGRVLLMRQQQGAGAGGSAGALAGAKSRMVGVKFTVRAPVPPLSLHLQGV